MIDMKHRKNKKLDKHALTLSSRSLLPNNNLVVDELTSNLYIQ